MAGLLGDPGEPICDGDHPGDRPDASEAPDGEKLGPPGVIPLADFERKKISFELHSRMESNNNQEPNLVLNSLGPIGDASGCDGVCVSHGVRPGLNVDGVAAPKNMPLAPNGPGPKVL